MIIDYVVKRAIDTVVDVKGLVVTFATFATINLGRNGC